MSVQYNNKIVKAKKKIGLLTLNLSSKKIKNIGDIIGLDSLTAGTQLTPTRFLTVTSTSDEVGSVSERCNQVVTCTLRRAINEVKYYYYLDETYLISFDLDTDDPATTRRTASG